MPTPSRLAVVTGAGRGLGRAAAVALARAGYDVALAARSADALADTARLVRAEGARAFTAALDVTEAAAVHAWARRLLAEVSAPSVLLLNAGQFYTGSLTEMPVEHIEGMVRTAVFGALWPSRAFLPGMMARGTGHIVVVASAAVAPGRPASGGPSVAYLTAKHGMSAFARALREELRATGIRVTTIYPGAMTGTADAPPALSVEQVARTLLDLVLPDAPYVEDLVIVPPPPS
jgi:NAD(P)-dependent dehydrogenase (short-subunit alcohol dehydrogenase family)